MMASVWITRRTTRNGEPRFRCEFRLGGREARTQYGGSFRTRREAVERRAWIAGELAARHVPNLSSLAEAPSAPTLRDAIKRWQEPASTSARARGRFTGSR